MVRKVHFWAAEVIVSTAVRRRAGAGRWGLHHGGVDGQDPSCPFLEPAVWAVSPRTPVAAPVWT